MTVPVTASYPRIPYGETSFPRIRRNRWLYVDKTRYREWYNGYRFAKTAPGDLYNTDMVLHYLKQSIPNEPMPDDLIDPDIRIDYTKLRHVIGETYPCNAPRPVRSPHPPSGASVPPHRPRLPQGQAHPHPQGLLLRRRARYVEALATGALPAGT